MPFRLMRTADGHFSPDPDNDPMSDTNVRKAIDSGREYVVLTQSEESDYFDVSVHRFKLIAKIHRFVAELFKKKGKTVAMMSAEDLKKDLADSESIALDSRRVKHRKMAE